MSERPLDDTPERDERSPEKKEPKPGSYYYDDSTGYEIYDPEKEDEEAEEDLYGQGVFECGMRISECGIRKAEHRTQDSEGNLLSSES